MKTAVKVLLPLYLTYAYQLIPVPVRKLWGMRGSGSSCILVGIAMAGGTDSLWPVFFRCCWGVIYLPGYLVGSVLRLLGRGSLAGPGSFESWPLPFNSAGTGTVIPPVPPVGG